MNKKTKKILSFFSGIWEKHKIPVVLVGVLIVTGLTAAGATCGSCGS